MSKFMKSVLTMAVAIVVGLAATVGNGAAKRTEKAPAKAAASKAESFVVVQIGDQMQVVKKSELTSLRKSTAEEDKKAKKDYDEAKKTAAKNKDKADLGKPPAHRKVIVKKSFKSEQEANDWLDQNQNKEEPAGAAVGGKKKKVY
jgi:hypothetical protein